MLERKVCMAKIVPLSRFARKKDEREHKKEEATPLSLLCEEVRKAVKERALKRPAELDALRRYFKIVRNRDLLVAKLRDIRREDWARRPAFLLALVEEIEIRFPFEFGNRP